MNEHLQNLARRAGFIGTNFGNTVIGTDQETALANFAELIVQECCGVFVELRTRPADLAVLDVKKHFGVK